LRIDGKGDTSGPGAVESISADGDGTKSWARHGVTNRRKITTAAVFLAWILIFIAHLKEN
jgi:hypothetical protein